MNSIADGILSTTSDAYEPRTVKRFRRTRAEIGDLDTVIISILQIEAPLTLRQLYYRLVAAGSIDKTEAAYGTVKRRLLDLRESRRVPWRFVADNTRFVHAVDTFDGPAAALADTARLYRRDLMRSQPTRIEVWAESDSIGSVLSEVTDEYGIPLYVGRGYSSRALLRSAAEQIEQAGAGGKRTLILHLGDFDPSGEDISRTVRDTLSRYVTELWADRTFGARARIALATMSESTSMFFGLAPLPEFERLAVTEQQIAQLDLPFRPVKASDPRSRRFRGQGSVEIEAIPRNVILAILRDRIEQTLDHRALEVVRIAEASEREVLLNIAASAGGSVS